MLSEVMKVYKTYPCGVTLLAQKEGKKCTKSTQKSIFWRGGNPKKRLVYGYLPHFSLLERLPVMIFSRSIWAIFTPFEVKRRKNMQIFVEQNHHLVMRLAPKHLAFSSKTQGYLQQNAELFAAKRRVKTYVLRG